MAASTPYNIDDAVKPDGLVDFYALLNETPNASSEDLRGRINALYSEAQANRDHRNLNKRRDYQTLLDLLPKARTVLLDEDKRARYNSYLLDATAGTAPVSFQVFIDDLTGATTAMEDRTDVLGAGEGKTAATRTTADRPVSTTKSKAAKGSQAKASLVGSAISVIVFFVLLLACTLVMHMDLPKSILIGAIAGAVTWFITHATGSKVSR